MRSASRLLASIKPARFLEAGNPTGLTGLYTHQAPRSTLLYLYKVTLDKLKAIPEHSVYRQSSERIIKHRMSIVEAIKPTGYEEWVQRAAKTIEQNPDHFKSATPGPYRLSHHGGSKFVVLQEQTEEDERLVAWAGEDEGGKGDEREDPSAIRSEECPGGEGAVMETSKELQTAVESTKANDLAPIDYIDGRRPITWENEPQLEASQ